MNLIANLTLLIYPGNDADVLGAAELILENQLVVDETVSEGLLSRAFCICPLAVACIHSWPPY